MLNGYPQPRSKAIFPLAIAGIGAFTVFSLKLSSFYSVIGFSLCLFLATVFSRSRSIHASSTRRIMVILSVVFLITLLFAPTVRAAAITEYYLPPGSTQPYGITFEPTSGNPPYNVWFAEFGSSRIGRKTTGASFTDTVEFQLAIGSKPYGMAFDSTGIIFFTESSRNSIGSIIISSASLAEYTLPDGADPRGIAVVIPNIKIMFAEYGRHAIASLTAGAPPVVTEYFLPDSNARPEGILYLPNSGIWFTEYVGDRIGFLSPSGTLLKEWPLIAGSLPHSLSNDSFGNIWFTESGRNRIARLNPYTNEITEYVIPTANAQPFGIVVDVRNNVWFAEHGTGKIGRFTPGTNVFVEFSRPGGAVWDMQLAPDGKIWFSDDAGHRIGRIDPDVATTSLTVPGISTATPSSSTATTLGTSSATTSTTAASTVTQTFYSTTTGITTSANITSATTTSTTSYSASETSSMVRTSSQAVFTSYVTQTLPTTITSTSYSTTTTGTTSVTATVTSTSFQTSTVTTTSTQTSYLATTSSTETVTITTTVTLTSFTFGADIGMANFSSRGGFLLISGLVAVGSLGRMKGRLRSALRGAANKTRWKTLAVTLFFLAILFTMILPSRGAAFTEWNLQYGSTAPYGLAFDDQSPANLWFAEYTGDRIGRLNPSTSEIREIVLSAGSHPWDIVFESAQKELWFTESGHNIIGRITNYGTGLSEFSLTEMFGPAYGEGPRGLAVQEHVNGTNKPYIWVAEFGANAILRLDPYDVSKATRWFLSPSSGPQSIVFSNEIGLWFTEYQSGRIGNLNPATGTVREWQVTAGSSPWDLAVDSKNSIWYSDPGRNAISRLNPYTGKVVEYLIPSAASQPYGITIDSRGWIWFAEHGLNKIGRFVPDDGTFTEYPRMTGVSLWGATLAPASNILWFGDDSSNRLVRFDPSVAITTTTTNMVSTASTSTWSLSPTAIITPAPTSTTTKYHDGSTTVSFATTTSTTSYQVTETATVLLTTSTLTSTVYTSETQVVLTASTSYYSSTVGTQTSTSTVTLMSTQTGSTTVSATKTSTATATTTTTTTLVISTGFIGPGIPGFPIESIIVGIGLAAAFLAALSRIRRRSSGGR